MSLIFVSGSISLVLACNSGLYLFVWVTIRSTRFFLNPFPLKMTHFKRSALILRFWTAHKRWMRIKASASLKAHRIASHRISHMRAHMRAFNNTGTTVRITDVERIGSVACIFSLLIVCNYNSSINVLHMFMNLSTFSVSPSKSFDILFLL